MNLKLIQIFIGAIFIFFIAFLTTSVGVLGSLDFFGVWGHTFFVERDFILLAALCLASGIQNGAISSASGAQVRTTHLTGITTDLGLGIVRLLSKGRRHGDYPKELFGNILRLALILAFVIGSVVGAKIFMNFEYYGFFLPGFISTNLYIYALFQK